ncbi:helix-turn-helix domain-containing protein [Rubrobacter marinus]|uniref:Helix-turn-helix domain-containing protein n=1 Tax=Rubrobacter marinus TaxID=2653852 RepID=A0A6G8PUN3_9ACTN|nr:Crp/Fnr family transcriptional regulator [Rubrobacter marinus]QIN77912.1 helix-turn-helix domain-containing protein [Rubrobacter marinus]
MSETENGNSTLRGNKLFGALDEGELERLRPHLEVVALELKQVLYEADKPIEYVYFPIDSVSSVIATMEDGQAVEVGTIGNEGMTGLPVFLGAKTAPLTSFCQIPGKAIRMASESLRAEVVPGSRLHELLQRHTEATFVFAAQSSACNRLHSVEQRAARWLLHTHDRVDGGEFALTQEFLSQMLGVRRASVSAAAGALQGEGLIAYSRGNVRVLDRAGLEARTCECYRVIRREFDRMIGD